MSPQPIQITSQAIAYLKGVVPESDLAPPLEVSLDDSPVLRSLNDKLVVSYVADQCDKFQFIQNRDLSSDGIDAEGLHKIGVANLERRASHGIRVYPDPNRTVFGVVLDGNFEASLILLDSLWEDSFRQFVSGQYAIAVPARDILAFCDVSSAAGLHELRQVINRLKTAGADHRLADNLFVRTGNEWVVLN